MILLFVFFCCACAVGFAQKAVTIDEAIKQASTYLTDTIPDKSIVALNIKSDTKEIREHMKKISELLVNNSALEVVDRDNLDSIWQEERFQLSGEVSDKTAQRIGQKLGAQTIILGSFIHIGSKYQMYIRAIAVETGIVQGEKIIPVKMDKILYELLSKSEHTGTFYPWDGLNDKNRLYLGARAGLSLGFYDNPGGLVEKSVTLTGIPAFDGSLYASVSIWSLFALQTEALITNDSFDFTGNTSLKTVSYNSLIIPLLVKLVYRPSVFTVQGFAGPYLSLPMGQMEVKHRNGSYNADFPLMTGFMAGGGFGVKLGPGYVMADVRYATDFKNVTANYNGTKDTVSHRNKVYFALGYEIGLIQKNKE